jgi:hypothetical protein
LKCSLNHFIEDKVAKSKSTFAAHAGVSIGGLHQRGRIAFNMFGQAQGSAAALILKVLDDEKAIASAPELIRNLRGLLVEVCEHMTIDVAFNTFISVLKEFERNGNVTDAGAKPVIDRLTELSKLRFKVGGKVANLDDHATPAAVEHLAVPGAGTHESRATPSPRFRRKSANVQRTPEVGKIKL